MSMIKNMDTISSMESFNNNATTYPTFNFLQHRIAGELLALCAANLPPMRSCIDIGCGNGAMWQQIDTARTIDSPQSPFVSPLHTFVGLDSAPNLLDLHARSPIVRLVCGDFNRPLRAQIGDETFDVALASSSLQWADDLEQTLLEIANIAPHLGAAIFTARSLHELHAFVGIPSPLLDSATLRHKLEAVFCGFCLPQLYTISFENLHALLRYLQKSGIRGQTTLDTAQTQKLRHFQENKLVFEVLYFVGTRRN